MGINKRRLKTLNVASKKIYCSVCSKWIDQDKDFLIRTHTTFSSTYTGPASDHFTTHQAYYHVDCFLKLKETYKLEKEIEYLTLKTKKKDLEKAWGVLNDG